MVPKDVRESDDVSEEGGRGGRGRMGGEGWMSLNP